MPAKLIDRYVLERVIGTGGFATVWLAHDPVVGVDVALKVLADNWARDPDMRERFVSEARLGLQINSPRIMRVHVVNESADGIPYIVMAFADGGTLRERTRNRALSGVRFSVSEAIDIAREIALGLEELHQAGHLHRDVKPANVLFQSTPRGEQLVLSDFGLARAVDKTAITQIAGSPAYMAPEQAAGVSQLSPAVDLYPLGVILAELLAGVSPTEVSTLTEAADQGSIDVAGFFADHNVAIPAELAELVGDLVALDPQRRPLSAGLAARRLQHIGQKLAGSSVGEIAANPPSFAPRTKVADGPPGRPCATDG